MSLLEFIKKIKLKSPKQSDVLIFDEAGSDFLSRHVLYGIDHGIFHSRQEFFYCGLKVITYTLLHVNITNIVKSKKIVSEFYKAYLLGCFHCIKPKVVLTFIDYEHIFHWLSRAYTNATFYAIQRGLRAINDSWDYTDSDLKEGILFAGGCLSTLCVTNLICFGKNEEVFYRKYGAKVDNYHPVGSLRGSYYKYVLRQDPPDNKYNLCLVSQYREKLFEAQKYSHLKKSIMTMDIFIKQFVEETGVSLCIATSMGSTDEYKYFQSVFGENVTIIKYNELAFSTFRAMDESEVIIANFSTAALEAFGWGKKILYCNYTDNPLYSFTFSDLCTTDIADYDIFKEKLQKLLNMDSETFLNETLDKRKYYMNYDPNNPATVYLRRLVLEHIAVKV